MGRREVIKPGLTPMEQARAILGASDVYGLDRWDSAERRSDLLRARIAHAIEAAVLETFVLARQVVARESRPTLVLGELIAESRREVERIGDWIEKNTDDKTGGEVTS